MAQTPPWDETPLPDSLASVGESTPSAGWFRFHFDDERWEWSPEVEQMHGYEAGTTEPTTELLLSHKHPDDYAEVAEALEYVRRTHGAISTRHRIIDANGRTREVIVVASNCTMARSSKPIPNIAHAVQNSVILAAFRDSSA